MAGMAQAMVHVVKRIDAIEKAPILKNGPEYYARILERSAESVMRIPVTQFENQARDLQRTTREWRTISSARGNVASKIGISPT